MFSKKPKAFINLPDPKFSHKIIFHLKSITQIFIDNTLGSTLSIKNIVYTIRKRKIYFKK